MSKREIIENFSQDIMPDFNETATDYAKYRQGFPEEFFHNLIEQNVCDYDDYILDVGTGTGTIARGMAQLGYHTYAIDPAKNLIEEAKKIDHLFDVNVAYSVAQAEQNQFEENYFDLILAGQCWHWFNQQDAMQEMNHIPTGSRKFRIATRSRHVS